jgi:hypothetical protein
MNILNKIFLYFSNQDFLFTIIVTILSNYSYELVSTFINTIIVPVLTREDDDGNDRKNSKINYKPFLRSVIKFSLLISIISIFIILSSK